MNNIHKQVPGTHLFYCLDLVEEVGIATITRIDVPIRFRGRGYGTELLKEVCRQADKEKCILQLTASVSLVQWFRHHGFRSHPIEADFMVRHPKGKRKPSIIELFERNFKETKKWKI